MSHPTKEAEYKKEGIYSLFDRGMPKGNIFWSMNNVFFILWCLYNNKNMINLMDGYKKWFCEGLIFFDIWKSSQFSLWD